MTYVRKQRRALGLSQEEVARRVGWSQSKISRLESGAQRLSYSGAQDLGAALKTNAARLYDAHERDVLKTWARLIDRTLKGHSTSPEDFQTALKDKGFATVFRQAAMSAAEADPAIATLVLKAVEDAADLDIAVKSHGDAEDASRFANADAVGRPVRDREGDVEIAEKAREPFDAFGRPRERDREGVRDVATKAARAEADFDAFGRSVDRDAPPRSSGDVAVKERGRRDDFDAVGRPKKEAQKEKFDAAGRARPVTHPETPRGRSAPTDDERERQRITEELEREKRRERQRIAEESGRWTPSSVPGISESAQKALASAPVLGRPAVEKFLKEGRDVSVTEGFGLMQAAAKAAPSIAETPEFKGVVAELMSRAESGEK